MPKITTGKNMYVKRIKRSRKIETWRETVDRHMLAGTCYICGVEVRNGADPEPRHGLTGAHWDCMEKQRLRIEDWLGPAETRNYPVKARANGGSLFHWVIPVTRTALCGHKPKDTAKHMTVRGKWLYLKDEAVGKFCSGCVTKLAVRRESVPTSS